MPTEKELMVCEFGMCDGSGSYSVGMFDDISEKRCLCDIFDDMDDDSDNHCDV